MIHIKAPTVFQKTNDNQFQIFVAGGISNCPDWQTEFVQHFLEYDNSVILTNPRRYDFDTSKSEMSEEQIKWEFNQLHQSDLIVFYFPSETLCPITLYELGVMAGKHKNILVSTHPDYARRFDVIQQLALLRPDLLVLESLDDLIRATKIKIESK